MAINPILDRLFYLILYQEVIKHKTNNLIQINLRHLIIRLEEIPKNDSNEKILHELFVNYKLRNTVYSCLINCALPEYRNMTPFYVSCMLGRTQIFKYFCKYEPNINCYDITGTFCIHAAIRCENNEIFQTLLEMNANCTCPNKLGETPLMCACSKKLENISMQLIDKFNTTNSLENQKALCIACQNGLIDVAHKMILKGVSIFSLFCI